MKPQLKATATPYHFKAEMGGKAGKERQSASVPCGGATDEREPERARERERAREGEREKAREKETERDRKRDRERESERVCVREREREIERGRKREREGFGTRCYFEDADRTHYKTVRKHARERLCFRDADSTNRNTGLTHVVVHEHAGELTDMCAQNSPVCDISTDGVREGGEVHAPLQEDGEAYSR